MDPVGSWSAYAASYNRLANASSFQNPTSSDLHHHMGTGVQATSSTTTQLLAAHATSSLASSAASPFNPTGFLSPPPVGYDVFPPLFHQKAHYGIQHRPLKQPEADAYNQMGPNNFFEQSNTPSLAWSQNNAQLPSPFGILPHESVVPNSGVSPKTYENFNAHFAAAQSLNQFNSQISDYKNSSFIDPKKRPLSPIPKATVSTPFYQQTFVPTEQNLNYRQSDYSVRSFQNGNLQQACNVPSSISQGKEHRVLQPVRPQFPSQRNEKLNFTSPKQGIQKVPNKVYESEKRVEHDSQSSPISFAMIDAQRNFLSNKHRNQPFQNIPVQQNYRFPMTPESDYQRSKSTESFGSTSSNPDCTIGLPRRPSPLQAHVSPNNAPSPVYPMYNSPLTTISSPSPVQHEACFNKPSDITPPLDVSVSRSSVPYNSVITRSDVRFDRQDYNKQSWDDRQRRYPGYENSNGQNRQQYYDPSPQVNLQDLSSCRGDPMSLVKTLQQQQPEKVSEDKSKKKQKSTDKSSDVDYFPRVPPPAHHNPNQPNQNGYYDSERWNLAPPPSKIFPSSPVPFGSQPPIGSNLPNQHQSLMVPHPPLPLPYFSSLPYVPQSQPPEEAVGAEVETEQPKVIVPSIEEELRCLLETDFGNEEVRPTKKLPLNPGKSFMSSFVKYLHGEKDSSPPPNLRPIRRTMKPKIFQQAEIHVDEVANGSSTPVPEFPSDPQDDPRYFPLPKSSDKRSFDSSDSDGDNSFSFNSKVDKKVETPPPTPVDKEVPPFKEDVTAKSERRKKKKKKKKDGKKKKKNKEAYHDQPRPRRETSKRKAKEMSVPLLDQLDNNSSDLSNTDSDPVWVPTEKPLNDKKKLNKSRLVRKQPAKRISSESSDEDDVPLAERTVRKIKKKIKSQKKNIQAAKKLVPEIITAAKPTSHSSSKLNQLPFNVGDFVVLKTDLFLRHPPLWRVKEKTMLQKFQHYMKNGFPLYENLPCYTGWSPESKHVYEGVTVKVLSTTKHDMVVQLLSSDIQELSAEERAVIESIIESTLNYQDYFEVYVQTLFSQALDTNFLIEIFQEKDEYFLSNVRAVDDHVKDVEKRLISFLDWNEKFTSAVKQYSSYNSYPRNGTVCNCGASGSCQLILSGIPYDKDTLQKRNEPESSVEAVLCRNCLSEVEVLHKLCHFKCSLYTVCEERVKEKRDAEPEKDTTVVLNDLLADDVWLNQIFRSIQKEWGYAELLIGKLSKELPEN
ncbi:uncharacterized protein [Halyomorpha halys]|uniref:uncharacterized protein isoform X2 n=1 Tax=Halyomorpha halys TaxID=286706 RepID=UPI0006D500B0|nr:uncharacterized protein LOC106692551 [Halyomorpha halys]